MVNKIVVILIVLAIIFGGWLLYSNNKLVENTNQVVINNTNEELDKIEGPSIKVDPDVHDLGTVIYGDVPERIFKITNLGNEILEISKLSTSCGCTKASLAEEDKIIAPGDSVDMLVTFDPAVHKDDSDLGDLVRVIYIKTNDPDQSEVEVEITANVVKQD
jgi:hypothetical protein